MKDIKKILERLNKLDERLEKKSLTWDEVDDYRKDGYYVLINKRQVDTLGDKESICYISKSEDEVLDKYKSYKRRSSYLILSPIDKSSSSFSKVKPEDTRGPGLPSW